MIANYLRTCLHTCPYVLQRNIYLLMNTIRFLKKSKENTSVVLAIQSACKQLIQRSVLLVNDSFCAYIALHFGSSGTTTAGS